MFADIALPVAVREVFTYRLPDSLAEHARPGMRAWVPLRGRMSIGMIVRIHDKTPSFSTKEVRRLLDTEPVLSSEMIELTKWMSRFYVCGQGEVIQAALPSGLNFSSRTFIKAIGEEESYSGLTKAEQELVEEVRSRERYPLAEAQQRWKSSARLISSLRKKKHIELWDEPQLDLKPKTEQAWFWKGRPVETGGADTGKASTKWEEALSQLAARNPLPATTTELTALDESFTPYTLKRLEKEGVIEKREREVPPEFQAYPYEPDSLSALNEHQEKVTDEITRQLETARYRKFLLYGITGSGKTEVYIHALKAALDAGKDALVLVPEIALTPQTVRRFYRVFGSTVAILHSRLSERERYEAWQALRRGEKRIAIGARSAIFAPLHNPGIIIIDEEHDSSYYQSDPAPRYHVREVAAVRAWKAGAVLVMGSATPGLVSLNETTSGKSTLLKLPSRHSGAMLPDVSVLNLSEYRSAMRGPLAVPLHKAVHETASRGEQAILLYNRRGFASFLQCEDCGFVVECPDCSVSLTYHKKQHHLRCHYCGFSTKVPRACPSCDSSALAMQGSGTQQIETELEGLFPELRVLRMDQDTTSRKDAHDRILSAFGRGEADMLIGTQLVAKGLDFPNVTLVGVINADTELAFPSYRSNERMFQLLSQVAGRSGRSSKKGVVYLQTMQPDHFALKFAQKHDYENFARHEMSLRKSLLYPPFSRLLNVQFRGRDAVLTRKAAEQFTEVMHQAKTEYPVLGPAPDVIERMKGEFRWVSMMKLPASIKTARIEKLCDYLLHWYDKTKPEGASTVRVTLRHEMM